MSIWVVIRQLSTHEIDDGTRCITRYDHSPENVSANTSWQEASYSPEAERLIDAFVVLDEFYGLLLQLYATLQADKTLKALHGAS